VEKALLTAFDIKFAFSHGRRAKSSAAPSSASRPNLARPDMLTALGFTSAGSTPPTSMSAAR
jgi:hypothetical protein